LRILLKIFQEGIDEKESSHSFHHFFNQKKLYSDKRLEWPNLLDLLNSNKKTEVKLDLQKKLCRTL